MGGIDLINAGALALKRSARGKDMPDFTVAIALLRRPIEKAYDACAAALKSKIIKLKVDGKVEGLHSKLWQLQRVKTIWNPDRPLALSTIYSPVRVVYEVDGKLIDKQADSILDLHYPRCLIQGTAGQGKSILLKHLLGREIRSGERVPLLYELRNFRDGKLEDSLAAAFSELLSVAHDPAYFTVFCEQGIISLLLDGFDEVSKDLAQQVLSGIERISQRYPDTKIILTTRPDSGYQGLSLFTTVKIKPLERGDLKVFFKKLTKDDVFSKKLMAAIESSPVGVRDLITTPLAATLLTIIYRASGKIPDEFSEFFEEFFQVLGVRHDASKLGWRRHRSSSLTDRQLQQVFEAYCFQVRRRKMFSCSSEDAVRYAKEGLSALGFTADADICLQDIRKVTCLIIEEGRRVDFVHTSVASYFAAKFVTSLADSVAKKFYGHLLEGNWVHWISELEFLRKIDSTRMFEHFLLPDIEKMISRIDERKGASVVAELIMKGGVLERRSGKDGVSVSYAATRSPPLSYCFRDVSNSAFDHIFSRHAVTSVFWISSEVVRGMRNGDKVTWYAIAKSRGESVFAAFVEEVVSKGVDLRKQLAEMRSAVERSKADSGIFTID